jgi:hypothetical protein
MTGKPLVVSLFQRLSCPADTPIVSKHQHPIHRIQPKKGLQTGVLWAQFLFWQSGLMTQHPLAIAGAALHLQMGTWAEDHLISPNFSIFSE